MLQKKFMMTRKVKHCLSALWISSKLDVAVTFSQDVLTPMVQEHTECMGKERKFSDEWRNFNFCRIKGKSIIKASKVCLKDLQQ